MMTQKMTTMTVSRSFITLVLAFINHDDVSNSFVLPHSFLCRTSSPSLMGGRLFAEREPYKADDDSTTGGSGDSFSSGNWWDEAGQPERKVAPTTDGHFQTYTDVRKAAYYMEKPSVDNDVGVWEKGASESSGEPINTDQSEEITVEEKPPLSSLDQGEIKLDADITASKRRGPTNEAELITNAGNFESRMEKNRAAAERLRAPKVKPDAPEIDYGNDVTNAGNFLSRMEKHNQQMAAMNKGQVPEPSVAATKDKGKGSADKQKVAPVQISEDLRESNYGANLVTNAGNFVSRMEKNRAAAEKLRNPQKTTTTANRTTNQEIADKLTLPTTKHSTDRIESKPKDIVTSKRKGPTNKAELITNAGNFESRMEKNRAAAERLRSPRVKSDAPKIDYGNDVTNAGNFLSRMEKHNQQKAAVKKVQVPEPSIAATKDKGGVSADKQKTATPVTTVVETTISDVSTSDEAKFITNGGNFESKMEKNRAAAEKLRAPKVKSEAPEIDYGNDVTNAGNFLSRMEKHNQQKAAVKKVQVPEPSIAATKDKGGVSVDKQKTATPVAKVVETTISDVSTSDEAKFITNGGNFVSRMEKNRAAAEKLRAPKVKSDAPEINYGNDVTNAGRFISRRERHAQMAEKAHSKKNKSEVTYGEEVTNAGGFESRTEKHAKTSEKLPSNDNSGSWWEGVGESGDLETYTDKQRRSAGKTQ